MTLLATKKFKAHVVREYSMTPTPEKLGYLDNEMELYYDEDNEQGSINWEVYDDKGDLVEDAGIGLWFNGKELVDYDGVFELPKEAIELLEEHGFNADYAK